jgi:polar amino acid transport system substrate-binding protein
MMRPRSTIVAVAAITMAASVAAACSTAHDRAAPDHLGGRSAAPAAATTTTTPTADCGDATASLRPQAPLPSPNQMPGGTYMRTIQERGSLVVGVDQNTLQLAARDPVDGQIKGFEIDLARQIAKAIFGDENRVELKAVSSAQRLPFVQDQTVDLAIDAVTVNCERLQCGNCNDRTPPFDEPVAFSTIYYDASQRVLVPTDSTATQLQDLAGKKVCATKGTTSIEFIRQYPSRPPLVPYPVKVRSDCLVALQERKVDAISGDDTILAGFRRQDPYTKIIGPPLEPEPYGMAINQDHPEFVRFVNGVLETVRADGTWSAVYSKWLGPFFDSVAPPPEPHYRD